MALQNTLFLAVLALLPVQLNKFFFIDASYVFGIPIDYRALSLYLSDIAVILFIALFFLGNFKSLKSNFSQNKNIYLSLILFNFYLIVNNFFRQGFPITFYFSLRIAILSLFFIAASQVISRKDFKNSINSILSISLIWQSALIIFQFLKQHSQGLWFLGERSFDSSTVSIAHVDIFGIQLLRSYGTFPHPNLAGAFLALGIIFIYMDKNRKSNTLKKTATILAIPALLLTFSRSSLAVFALSIMVLPQKFKSLFIKSVVFISVVVILLPVLINTQLASIAERITLTRASLDIAGTNLLTGVGNTNFLTQLAALDLISLAQTRLIQPVHNVFLLILSENGIVGFGLFITLLLFVSQKAKSKAKILLFVSLLIFASTDHFLWTLHQGQILFWLSLGYILSSKKV